MASPSSTPPSVRLFACRGVLANGVPCPLALKEQRVSSSNLKGNANRPYIICEGSHKEPTIGFHEKYITFTDLPYVWPLPPSIAGHHTLAMAIFAPYPPPLPSLLDFLSQSLPQAVNTSTVASPPLSMPTLTTSTAPMPSLAESTPSLPSRTMPTSSNPVGGTCGLPGCFLETNKKCSRLLCAAHCRLKGGCSVPAHVAAARAPEPPVFQSNAAAPGPSVSADPIADPRYHSQMPSIFTERMAQQEIARADREAAESARLAAARLVEHTVNVTAWTQDDSEPVQCSFQSGFTLPNFALNTNILLACGFPADCTALLLYTFTKRSWTRVEVGHVVALDDENRNILLKALGVVQCPQVEDVVKGCLKASGPSHFRENFQGERASIQDKASHHFIDLCTPRPPSQYLSSSPFKPTPTAAGPIPKLDILSRIDDQFSIYSTPTTTLGKRKSRDTTTPKPHPLSDILSSPFQPSPPSSPSPGRPRKLFHSYSSPDGQGSSSSSSLPAVRIPAKGRSFPSEFRYSEVVQIFEALERLPPTVTMAARFKEITGIKYVSSTFSEARARWKNALQQERDEAETDEGTLWGPWISKTERPGGKRRLLLQAERRAKRKEERSRMVFKKCREAPIINSTTEDESDSD
ncbi:hypothetical protein MD484_g5204, partial [Candolleomyces efflorescens]